VEIIVKMKSLSALAARQEIQADAMMEEDNQVRPFKNIAEMIKNEGEPMQDDDDEEIPCSVEE
jgi:hypothetical protein